MLKAFLMSRSPIQGFDHSNGHGRRQPGLEVVSRQSNLMVESSHAVPEARLREMLIEEIKRQNKPYGLYFRDVTGGFTNTGRQGLQAFKVIPIIVYKVYPDGRPDELIRGAESSARRWPASRRFWPRRTGRRFSTAIAARNRAACRFRRSRRRCWCRRSKSRRRTSRRIGRRCCHSRWRGSESAETGALTRAALKTAATPTEPRRPADAATVGACPPDSFF